MVEAATPNRDQAAAWNDASGRSWVELQVVLDRMLEPFERLLVAAGDPGEDGRVLDVGCGAGATTIAMARRVGAKGSCLGVDISAPLVAAARRRATAEGVDNASFVEADAQIHPFEPESFDAVISRFGVMFFDDPVAAFANIRHGARRNARLAFFAWRSIGENEFFATAARTVAPFMPPAPPPDPNAPGQFAFADREKVRSILSASGWSDIEVRPSDIACEVDARDMMAFLTRLGPGGAALREAGPETAEKLTAALSAAFATFVENDAARFTAACWLVTARA